MIQTPIIQLDPQDNIAVARLPLPKGTPLGIDDLVTLSDIPLGHKVAICPIAKGAAVSKYHTTIGYASRDVLPGTHMHLDTIDFAPSKGVPAFCTQYQKTPVLPVEQQRTFQGFARETGLVGTRNFIVIPVVSNCAATVARKIAQHFTPERLADYPNVDGVVPLITTLGCGMEKVGTQAMDYLRRILSGHITNPNVAGALVCALGCENNNIHTFFQSQGWEEGPLLHKLVIQDIGGSVAAVGAGIAIVEQMLPLANQAVRTSQPLSKLCVALQCGGSDAFSSISANPALGRAMDQLVHQGGTACLSETTELYSAEHTLVARAKTPEVGQALLDAIAWWLDYSKGKDIQINGTVTPGNQAGGLSNILEKALGSVKKGGSTGLNAVVGYGEPITESGLVIMDAPSYDPVSATAQFAGGCNLCVFTTGRGSAYGATYFPTIKVASNTPLFQRMPQDMDLNAGTVLDGIMTLDQVAEEILEAIIAVASGQPTKSELFGMGSDEFIPWTLSVTG